MLDHPAPDQSGDGQQQREPELVAEARHAVAGMLVVPGMDVTFSTRAGMRRLLAVRLMILMMMIVLRHGSAFLDAMMHRAPARSEGRYGGNGGVSQGKSRWVA